MDGGRGTVGNARDTIKAAPPPTPTFDSRAPHCAEYINKFNGK